MCFPTCVCEQGVRVGEGGDGGWEEAGEGASWKVGVVSPPACTVLRSQEDLLGFVANVRAQVLFRV